MGQQLRVSTGQVLVLVEVPVVVLVVEALEVLEVVVVDMMEQEALVVFLMQQVEMRGLWKKLFLESLGMIIQFLLKFQKHLSSVTDRLMVVIMLTQKQSARSSTFVPMMEMKAVQSTVFSVQMELCSTSSILYVIGGLMLTVH